MDFSKLFWLREAERAGALRVLPEDRRLDSITIAQGIREPLTPCRFRYDFGKRLYDLVTTGDPALVLLSETALQILREGGFTGWSSFPATIVGRKGKPIGGYEGLVITGRCGPVDWSKGKYTRRPPPVPQGQGYDAWLGVYFDPGTWDGSDLFMPEGTTLRSVTEPVKVAFEQAGITNVQFKPLTEFERSWPV